MKGRLSMSPGSALRQRARTRMLLRENRVTRGREKSRKRKRGHRHEEAGGEGRISLYLP
jgi:hypothetical protein